MSAIDAPAKLVGRQMCPSRAVGLRRSIPQFRRSDVIVGTAGIENVM